MKCRLLSLLAFCALIISFNQVAIAQRSGGQTELSIAQRLDVMSSKLDLMRRSLSSALSSMTPAAKTDDKSKPNADDPAVRLKGLEQEVTSFHPEVTAIRKKTDG